MAAATPAPSIAQPSGRTQVGVGIGRGEQAQRGGGGGAPGGVGGVRVAVEQRVELAGRRRVQQYKSTKVYNSAKVQKYKSVTYNGTNPVIKCPKTETV